MVYDWLHDAYYTNADLKQIRSDSSFIFPGRVQEIGYFGAGGTGRRQLGVLNRKAGELHLYVETTDALRLYYRRYFSGGGDGRIWLGSNGNGDGVLGGEIRVPMGT